MDVRNLCSQKRMVCLHLTARVQGPVQFDTRGRVVGTKDQSQVVSKLRESVSSFFSVCYGKGPSMKRREQYHFEVGD